ncbi:hypothetical protein [Cylindrospermopsis curvispora]|uniref:Uncharacterized protein n=1 Tax=Cylindrospermopsis curvispora GIHE-G1 TaxID=2666332 RepID=A0A7H0F332_9CYAN|nr:hypothetical protein [Cylindrospermopsis curvispora]QNP30448.1 hypothetical protein IAR63_05265 [Cylindrospermopsis curvispora GIHE-G1]BAZ90154.1 hypothetical protein NIES932_16490 [Raphidiopsis curvata NIES-932]
MTRPVERIEEDIDNLKQNFSSVATQLQENYGDYLVQLGESIHKQLILAVYHLCTQGYPEKFLHLSLNQRQQLQQSTRQLGRKAAQQLLVYLETKRPENTEDPQVPQAKSLDFSNPIEVVQWHRNVEEGIQNTLKTVSLEANLLLQKAGLLPKKLPEPILAAAASEATTEVIAGPPNLLNLVIEITNEKESEDSTLTQLVTINLRLGDIEFANHKLLEKSKQIRVILLQINKLAKEYSKKNQELKIAQAESAWRASWFDDI